MTEEEIREFDGRACEELIHQGHTTSLTITPSLWIRRTHVVGMRVKQGKGGGVSAYPEIVADFHLWLDPKRGWQLLGNKHSLSETLLRVEEMNVSWKKYFYHTVVRISPL